MKKTQKIMEWLNLIFERPYIVDEIKYSKGPLLMHMSDTPSEIFKYIIELVKILNPSYIIHTGDLVDNIKLELTPQKRGKYIDLLNPFIEGLEGASNAKIYYAMGNHDEAKIVREAVQDGIVMESGHIKIEGLQFYSNHYYLDENLQTQYYLYGHSFEPKSYKNQKHVGLNGIEGINVIDLSSEKIWVLPYPLGTNQFRKMELRSTGL